MRLLRAITVAVLFVVGVVAARSLVDSAVPLTYSGTAANKFAAFEAEADQFDLLYLGSSHVWRDIDPAVVEGRLSEQGIEVSSFNLGIPGAQALESREILRDVLELSPQRLRWIVLEPVKIEAEVNEANLRSDRVVAWHGLGNTIAVLQQQQADGGVFDRLDLVWGHLVSWLDNALGTGAVLRSLEASAELAPDSVLDVGEDGDGFMPLDVALAVARQTGDSQQTRSIASRRNRFVDEGELEYERWLRRLTRRAAEPADVSTIEREYLEEILGLAAEHDVRVIFLAAPGRDYATGWLGAAAAQGVVGDFVDLVDPEAIPEIYRFDLWYDRAHLSSRGAEILSTALAADMAPLLAEDLGIELAEPVPVEQPGIDWAALSEGFAVEDGGLRRVDNEAWLGIPEDLAGKVLAVEFGTEVARPGGQIEVLPEGSDQWTAVGPEIVARNGGWAAFEIPPGRVRLAVFGRLGTEVVDIAVLEPNSLDTWAWSGFEVDGHSLVKSRSGAALLPPEGVTLVALLPGEPQGRPAVRVEIVEANGEVLVSGDPRGLNAGQWTVLVLPVEEATAAGATVRIGLQGSVGQRLDALASG